MPSHKNELFLQAMQLVEQCSLRLDTLSWVWGGFTADIYQNQFLREHDDLDYLTLNLHSLMSAFIRLFENYGWRTRVLENGDLKIKRGGTKIQFGHIELSGRVRWTHNGDQGSIWFHQEWLSTIPRNFCGVEVHAVEPEFQYVMLKRPQMLNPDWNCREKDIMAREYFRSCIESKGIEPDSLLEYVSAEKR